MLKVNHLVSICLLFALFSCKRQSPAWETEMLVPLLKSRVALQDAFQDNDLLQTNGDQSLTLVFRDTIADLLLADYITVPDTELAATVTLDSLVLSSDTLIQDITMYDIGVQLQAQGNLLGDYILNNDSGSIPVLLSTSGITSGDVAINAVNFFEEAELKEGNLVVRIENQLPFDINYVDFLLRNNGVRTDTLARSIVGPILSGTQVADTSDLSGQTVESDLVGKIEDMSINGGINVPINHADYLRLIISVEGLKAQRATAVFPAQTVINSLSNAKYDFGEDIEITRLGVKSGNLSIRAVSTIQDTLEFIYSLPTAIKENRAVEVTTLLNPAPAGGNIVNEQDFSLAGYFIDLTDDADSVNLFPQRLVANLKYSGNLVTADLADSIFVYYGLLDIIPDYIEGYLGKETFEFQETVQLDFFAGIGGGSLDLENPKVSLTFLNSIGIDGELDLRRVRATNTLNGNSVDLSGSALSQPLYIPGPRFPNVGQSVVSSLDLNRENSNIRNIIGLLPDQISFDMAVEANKNGNSGLRENFATDESRITAFLDMEAPLHGVADQLQLRDTLDFALGSGTIPSEISEGLLKLIAHNGFPLEAEVQVYFIDPGGIETAKLFDNGPAQLGAAALNTAGFVDTPQKSVLQAAFGSDKVQSLERANRAVVEFTLSTRPSGVPVKLYTTYGIDFNLVANFKAQTGL